MHFFHSTNPDFSIIDPCLYWLSIWPHPYTFRHKILYTICPVHATYLAYRLTTVSEECCLYNLLYPSYIEILTEHILLSMIMIFWDVTHCRYENLVLCCSESQCEVQCL
jgi:hypothetical protein